MTSHHSIHAYINNAIYDLVLNLKKIPRYFFNASKSCYFLKGFKEECFYRRTSKLPLTP